MRVKNWNRNRTILSVLIVAIATLFPFCAAEAACAPLATSKVVTNKGSYLPGDQLDVTYYYETDGSCTDVDKPHVKITFNNESGSIITVGETDCPRHDAGDGMFCELIGGKTFQFHVLTTFNFSGSATKGAIEGWAYNGPELVNKTYPPLEVGYGTGATGGTPAANTPASAEVPPVEANLAVQFAGLAKTSNIALYLVTLFNWGIPVVAILAVTMIAWGGVKWLTAGGDSGRVTSAKTTISNAVVGLILAFATYLILSTINPALTAFKAIDVPKVQRALFTQDNWCETIAMNAAQFTVSPALGHCGSFGDVSSPTGAAVLSDKCTFKTCGEAEGVCTRFKKSDGTTAYECRSCAGMDQERLVTAANVSPAFLGDSDCAGLSPERPQGNVSYERCVYSNEETASLGKGCKRLIVKDCKEVKARGCAGYDHETYVVGSEGADTSKYLTAETERHCAYDASVAGGCAMPSPSTHFKEVCEADPCGIGPCKAVATEMTTAKKIGAMLGQGDYWNCVPK